MSITIQARTDYSYLFSSLGTSSSSGTNLNFLSDYASIKNGSYAKLMKAYYNNVDNEGEILVKIENHSSMAFGIERGDRFCQGIFVKHYLTDNDDVDRERTGGVGSTAK